MATSYSLLLLLESAYERCLLPWYHPRREFWQQLEEVRSSKCGENIEFVFREDCSKAARLASGIFSTSRKHRAVKTTLPWFHPDSGKFWQKIHEMRIESSALVISFQGHGSLHDDVCLFLRSRPKIKCPQRYYQTTREAVAEIEKFHSAQPNLMRQMWAHFLPEEHRSSDNWRDILLEIFQTEKDLQLKQRKGLIMSEETLRRAINEIFGK